MKRFLTILFLFATIIAFGQQIEQFKQTNKLLDYFLQQDREINLTQGMDVDKIIKEKKYLDFNNFSTFETPSNFSYFQPVISTDNNYITNAPFDQYYRMDFAEDPFDGKIQILVMGEPLPSPLTTLICCFGVVGILLYYKKKKEVEA